MNRRMLFILGIILAVAAVAIGFVVLSSDAKEIDQEGSSQAPTNSQQPKQATAPAPTASSQPGQYIDYSDSALAAASGTKLIFFHAPWCPQCRDLEADIKKQGVPDDTTILKADYDTSQQLRQKYGVTIQTTVVKVDDQGNLVKKHVAYNEPTLSAVINNLR